MSGTLMCAARFFPYIATPFPLPPASPLPLPAVSWGTASGPPGIDWRPSLRRFKAQPIMDCRQFREKHVAFVDDVLPAIEMRAMQQHRAVCARCSRHDTSIRRSLLLVRNLPPIEPSADFAARLNERLALLGPAARTDIVSPRPLLPPTAAVAAIAAGVVVVAYMALQTSQYFERTIATQSVAVSTPVTL